MKRVYVFGPAEKFQNYAQALLGCGAEPFFSEDAGRADGCAGLLLPGGGDVDPQLFGEENRGSVSVDPELDRRELAALHAFVATGRPVLGICRGEQLINVAFGGSLIQDLPTAAAHRWLEPSGDQVHPITCHENGFLYALYGKDFPVNSAHHQGVLRLAEGFSATAWAADGVVEAIEDPQRKIYAVQFHPERMSFQKRREDTVDGRAIFDFFLSLC